MSYVHDSHKFNIPFPDKCLTGVDVSFDILKMKPNEERERYIVDHYLEGHIPSSCRNFYPVTIEFTGASSRMKRWVTVYVTGEYLSLGTDSDYVRCPLNPLSAQRIADKVGLVLPTPSIVDAIWNSAQIKLDPLPWGAPYDSSMMSSDRIVEHSHRIDVQIEKKGVDHIGKLIAGHKKDVVVHNVLKVNPKSVAIYGWHMSNGVPIQGLYYNKTTMTYNPYTGHENTYKDYSHGVRFVDRVALLSYGDYEILIDITSEKWNDEVWPAFGNERQNVWRQP